MTSSKPMVSPITYLYQYLDHLCPNGEWSARYFWVPHWDLKIMSKNSHNSTLSQSVLSSVFSILPRGILGASCPSLSLTYLQVLLIKRHVYLPKTAKYAQGKIIIKFLISTPLIQKLYFHFGKAEHKRAVHHLEKRYKIF